MLQRIIAALCAAAVAVCAAQERTSAPDPKHALTDAALVNALRSGGYTLFFRHTATDMTHPDRNPINVDDCETQRPLTDAGRDQARAIGRTFQALKLPVGEVLASPYCRTMETAKLMTGRARATDAVRGRVSPTGAPDYSGLGKIFATAPERSTLRIVAGHGNPFRAIAGPPHLEEGEAAVLRAAGSDWIVVARIKLADWERLAGF